MYAVVVAYLTENKETAKQSLSNGVLCGLAELNAVYYVTIVYYPYQKIHNKYIYIYIYIYKLYYIDLYIF